MSNSSIQSTPLTDKNYNYQCFIPFSMADPAGILFFGNVFPLFHQAYEQFIINSLKYPWTSWFQNPEWFVPLKHVEADYHQPIFAGQNCNIQLSIHSIGSSSLTLHSSIHQNHLCCLIKSAHVFCSHSTKQKIPIPKDIRDLINKCVE